MSYVQTIMVSVFLNDSVESLQSYLCDNNQGQMTLISEEAGGIKAMQMEVWGVATNYLNIDEFITVFKSLGLEYPESAQLFICNEHDERFRIIEYLPTGDD